MGIEHRYKEEEKLVFRCPCCGHLSTTKNGEDSAGLGMQFNISGEYFLCCNPKCEVERIYDSNCVTVLTAHNEQRKA